MEETTGQNVGRGELIPQPHGGAILKRSNGAPSVGGGRPRKGTSKLARMFSSRSRQALADAGLTIPPGARLTVEHYAELCRVHAVEAVECLAWIVRQRERSHQWGSLAAAAATDLLQYGFGAPDQKVSVQVAGTITHDAPAVVAWLQEIAGRGSGSLPAPIEGETVELSTGCKEPEPFNITPVMRSEPTYPQDMHRLSTGSIAAGEDAELADQGASTQAAEEADQAGGRPGSVVGGPGG